MGAGTYPAGFGRAGIDPTFGPTPARGTTTPRALVFDLVSRQFLQTAAGQFQDLHPVDQKVALALGVERNRLPSLNGFGQQLRARTTRVNPATVQRIVEDEVRLILKDLLTRGDIQLLAVESDNTIRGRVVVAVAYVNLRDPKTNLRNPALNQQTIRTA